MLAAAQLLLLNHLTVCSAGNALLTIATGELSNGQAERAGLVPTHAYAILNVVEVQVLRYACYL